MADRSSWQGGQSSARRGVGGRGHVGFTRGAQGTARPTSVGLLSLCVQPRPQHNPRPASHWHRASARCQARGHRSRFNGFGPRLRTDVRGQTVETVRCAPVGPTPGFSRVLMRGHPTPPAAPRGTPEPQHGFLGTLVGSVGTPFGLVGTLHGPVGTLVGPVRTLHGAVGRPDGLVGALRGLVGTLEGAIGRLSGPVGTSYGPIGMYFPPVGTLHGPVGASNRANVSSNRANLPSN